MEGVELERLIDKLAEKLGVAVEKVQPVLEEALHQIQLRGIVGAISAGVGILAAVLCAAVLRAAWSPSGTTDLDNQELQPMLAGCLLADGLIVAALACLLVGELRVLVSPLLTLLGR